MVWAITCFGFLIATISFLYDSYLHARFRFSSLSVYLLSVVVGVLLGVYGSQSEAFTYVFCVSMFCVWFLFFTRFHRSFLETNAVTKIISRDARKDAYDRIIRFISRIDQDIVILMRLYNEDKAILETLSDLYTHGFRHLVILDDGSTDASMSIIEQFTKSHKDMNIVTVSHVTRRGGGAANKTLFSIVREHTFSNRWFLTFDADGQMQASDIFSFLERSEKHKDVGVFLGSRFLQNSGVSNLSFIRKCILRGSRIVTYVFSRIWLTDPHNGFRMLHRDVIRDIQLQSDDMYYASEIVHIVQDRAWNYEEVPVHINYNSYTYQKGQQNRNALRILVHLLYEHIFFR